MSLYFSLDFRYDYCKTFAIIVANDNPPFTANYLQEIDQKDERSTQPGTRSSDQTGREDDISTAFNP
jgi:hypothetical protein